MVNEANRVRLLVADGRAAVREGLTRLLSRAPDLDVVATACSAETVAASVPPGGVDVAVLAVDLPGGVLTAAEALQRLAPAARWLAYGETAALGLDPRWAAASGVVDGAADSETLLALIRRAARPEEPPRTFTARGRAPIASPLTPREREILLLIAAGSSNARIAAATGLSPHTVRAHLRSITRKLGVRNRAHAVSAAVQSGQIVLDRAS